MSTFGKKTDSCIGETHDIRQFISMYSSFPEGATEGFGMNRKKVQREIWVVCENRDGEIPDVCFELLGKAVSLAAQNDSSASAVFFGEAPKNTALFASGAEKIYLLPGLDDTGEGAQAQALASLAKRHAPEAILLAATIRGHSLASQAAAQLGAGLTANCTDLHWEDGELIQTHSVFGGKLAVQVVGATGCLRMLTVRPRVFPPPAQVSEREGEIVRISPETLLAGKILAKGLELLNTEKTSGRRKSLSDADIILSGGMGLGSKEGFLKLQTLAERIGASPAASRAAVHAGFAPYSAQVGQTGATVRPRLYVAFGISGSVQHLAGMSASEYIVAVNTDGKAPIFRNAHFGLVADATKTLDLLLNEIV
jgi:electron transfer flavoprotein alpha subunit